MGIYNSGGTNYLLNTSPPITGYPFSIGCWIYPTTLASNSPIWRLGDNPAVAANYWLAVVVATTGAIRIQSTAGGVNQSSDHGAVAANTWNYVIFRFLSATNRRVDLLTNSGTAVEGTNTTSNSPSAASYFHIGGRPEALWYFTGGIAEFWYADSDVQEDNAQISVNTLYQLAHLGPFSVPYLKNKIVEYRSFVQSAESNIAIQDDLYTRGSPQVWAKTGTITTYHHPPLYPGYVPPNDSSRLIAV